MIGGALAAKGGPLLCALAIALAAATSAAAASRAEIVDGSYIVVLHSGADVTGAAVDHRRRLGVTPTRTYRHSLRGYAATLERDEVAALRRDPRVRSVTPDRLLTVAGQSTPTGRGRIAAPPPPAAAAAAARVRVAVIDIGVDAAHPDLDVAPGKDCSAPGTTYNPWHGTAVAGTLGARDNGAGIVGVAPGVALHAVRVTDLWATRPGTQTTWSSVVCAVDWVTSTRLDDDPANDIDVATMSLVGDNEDDGACGRLTDDALHRAICASTAAGVLYVAAAGNDGEDFGGRSPANYDEVLTATGIADSDGLPGGLATGSANCFAAEIDDEAASFSNFATARADEAHTIAAPAVCIRSTAVGGGYDTYGGTSMAAPHVAGAAALCIGSGRCRGSVPEMIATLRADAAAQGDADPNYGFVGDPFRPLGTGYFGPLVHAAAYGVEPAPPPDGGPPPVPDPPLVPDPPPVPEPPPAVAPSSPPAEPPVPPVDVDSVPPALGSTLRLTQKLRPVLKKGLAVRLRTHEAASVTVELLLDPRVADRLGLEQRVGVTTVHLPARGAHRVTVELSPAARRRLARRKRVKLSVPVRAEDTAGNAAAGPTRTTTLER